MAYSAKVILDSISPRGHRLTTIEVTYPRMIHAELMTHRVFSRNAASSRAIPVKKLLGRVMEEPYIPEKWTKNQAGMQGFEIIANPEVAQAVWLKARDAAHEAASTLAVGLDVHKQLANRLLEPFAWITVIITATDWQNFFKLRCDPAAQPEFQKIARMIQEEYNASTPKQLMRGDWHTPYMQPDEEHLRWPVKLKLATARCARVSYLTQDGKRDHEADFALYTRLLTGNHWSPFEHCARPAHNYESQLGGNFSGWVQFRKTFLGECANETIVPVHALVVCPCCS